MSNVVAKLQVDFHGKSESGKFRFIEDLLPKVDRFADEEMVNFYCECVNKLAYEYINSDIAFRQEHFIIYDLLEKVMRFENLKKANLAEAQYALGYFYQSDDARGAPQLDKTAKLWTAAADNDHVKATSRLSSLHSMGAFPGADPKKGVELLKKVAKPPNYKEMIELGILYFNGERLPQDRDKALNLIGDAVGELGDNVPHEHCFTLGMAFSQVKEEEFQRLSAHFLELTLANSEGMRQIEMHMGQQAVMMVNGMLQAVKGWLSTFEP